MAIKHIFSVTNRQYDYNTSTKRKKNIKKSIKTDKYLYNSENLTTFAVDF